MKINVLFANIFQGMIYAGSNEKKEHLFKSWSPSKYTEHFKQFSPDICCFAEMILDDEDGNSSVVEQMSKEYGLPYYKSLTGEKSWVVEGKYYGLSIISKYPIERYEDILLPNPKLEIIRPNGDHWFSHDKSIQKAVININGQLVNLFNLHGFPYHHFKRKMTDNEFLPIRLETVKTLNPDNKPSIICGDFNNEGIDIENALPELFINKDVSSAVTFNPIDYSGDLSNKNQVDHILVSKNFKINSSKVDNNYSDHCALIAEIEL